MSTALNDLQKQVAAALAAGKSPSEVRDQFALTSSSFEQWRQQDAFVAEVQRLKEADDADSLAKVDAETDRLSEMPGARA